MLPADVKIVPQAEGRPLGFALAPEGELVVVEVVLEINALQLGEPHAVLLYLHLRHVLKAAAAAAAARGGGRKSVSERAA
jgi:hypothetical protein